MQENTWMEKKIFWENSATNVINVSEVIISLLWQIAKNAKINDWNEYKFE